MAGLNSSIYIYIYIYIGQGHSRYLGHWAGPGQALFWVWQAFYKQLGLSNLSILRKYAFLVSWSLGDPENRIRGWKMIHFDGGNVSGRLKYDFLIFLRIFVHMLSLSPYICSYAVNIGVYLSICCRYWRIFVHMLWLLASICSYAVTIGVYIMRL